MHTFKTKSENLKMKPVSLIINCNSEHLGGFEADLHQHFSRCTKHPGHRDFIPIKSFCLHHLPEDFRDEDLLKLIKATADLTVRFGVDRVSAKRPQLWPKINQAYPLYDKRGGISVRSGSGELNVMRYRGGSGTDAGGNICSKDREKYVNSCKSCPCNKCQHSEKSSNVWWEIVTWTAAHVVFDEYEASHTSCRLFYDDQESPLVTLDNLTIDSVIIDRDVCCLKSVTCGHLGEKLYSMAVLRHNLIAKVKKKFINKPYEKLNFIVSHPHGCTKHVTIGYWIEKFNIIEIDAHTKVSMLTYNTPTCPGSSGAMVNCVTTRDAYCHTGIFCFGLNCSIFGFNFEERRKSYPKWRHIMSIFLLPLPWLFTVVLDII